MNLTKGEIEAIADRLDEILANHFADAIFDVCAHLLRENNDYEISDEDVKKIRNELKRIL